MDKIYDLRKHHSRFFHQRLFQQQQHYCNGKIFPLRESSENKTGGTVYCQVYMNFKEAALRVPLVTLTRGCVGHVGSGKGMVTVS